MASSEETEHPSWLTADFVQDALRHGGEEVAEVEGLHVSAATVAGDHYASTVLRVEAKLKTSGSLSFILKTLPASETMLQTVKDSYLFRTESRMLSDLIPRMNAMIEVNAPGRFTLFAPKYFHHGGDPSDFIVMEDLSPRGYRLAERVNGLGLRHSLLAVTTLGRFHGASNALIHEDPELKNTLMNGFLQPGPEISAFVKTGFQSVAAASRTWKDFPEEYANIIESLSDVAIQGFSKAFRTSSSCINAILHGDFWTNNMLFRYEEKLPVDIKLIDFQTSSVGPAVLDLLHFLNCSLGEEVSEKHTDLLIREYHYSLSETMKLLGLKPPTFEHLNREMDEHGFFGLFGAICVLPLVRARRDSGVDIESTFKGDTTQNLHIYASPVVERFLKRLLPMYHKKGWLPMKI